LALLLATVASVSLAQDVTQCGAGLLSFALGALDSEGNAEMSAACTNLAQCIEGQRADCDVCECFGYVDLTDTMVMTAVNAVGNCYATNAYTDYTIAEAIPCCNAFPGQRCPDSRVWGSQSNCGFGASSTLPECYSGEAFPNDCDDAATFLDTCNQNDIDAVFSYFTCDSQSVYPRYQLQSDYDVAACDVFANATVYDPNGAGDDDGGGASHMAALNVAVVVILSMLM